MPYGHAVAHRAWTALATVLLWGRMLLLLLLWGRGRQLLRRGLGSLLHLWVWRQSCTTTAATLWHETGQLNRVVVSAAAAAGGRGGQWWQ